MSGKPRSSILVAGRTSIPVKRTTPATPVARSASLNANSSIPIPSKVSENLSKELSRIFVKSIIVWRTREILVIVTWKSSNSYLTTDKMVSCVNSIPNFTWCVQVFTKRLFLDSLFSPCSFLKQDHFDQHPLEYIETFPCFRVQSRISPLFLRKY